jgi:hypothetical protein
LHFYDYEEMYPIEWIDMNCFKKIFLHFFYLFKRKKYFNRTKF